MLKKKLYELFNVLYRQVLDGAAFRDRHKTTLRAHFDEFSQVNRDITLCPICGIHPLKKRQDLSRDQYDHYLPKTKYPLSAINFQNLVPGCSDCNGLEVKGDKDVIEESGGVLFYPFDDAHEELTVCFGIEKDHPDIDEIGWTVNYSSDAGKKQEIEAWRKIYNIDGRHIGFIAPRIAKWFKHRMQVHDATIRQGGDENTFEITYTQCLHFDQEHHLNFLRKPSLDCFIQESVLARATEEAKFYR